MINKKKIGTIIGTGAVALTVGATAFLHQTPTEAGPVNFAANHYQVRDYNDHHGNHNGGRHYAQVQAQFSQALANLQSAQATLNNIAPEPEFNGHRQKALDLTKQAINELKMAQRNDHH